MNTLYIFLQAAAEGAPKGSSWSMWVMLILIFVVMWLFMIRPQQKQQKELEKFRNSLQKGDKVVSVGGIHGKVVEIRETTLLLEIDNAVKIEIDKASVVKDPSSAPKAEEKK